MRVGYSFLYLCQLYLTLIETYVTLCISNIFDIYRGDYESCKRISSQTKYVSITVI